MDNFTQTLTGLALSQAGLNRRTRFATLALLIGSNLPDVDVVTRLGGAAAYLKYHRGLTHSFLGMTILAGLLAGALYWLGKRHPSSRKATPPLSLGWLFAVSLIGIGVSVLFDFANPYGIRPFLPVSGRWYAWDIIPVVDVVMLVLLTLGLVIPALARLISEEVGARKPGFRWGAMGALCGVLALGTARDLSHRRALNLLDSHTYGNELPQRLAAFPSPTTPFAWTGVVETDTVYRIIPVNALESDVGLASMIVIHKPETSPALEAAMQTRTATIFSEFARFPSARIVETEDGFEVTLRDLRFFSFSRVRKSFVLDIQLDRDFHVRSERFHLSRETKPTEF